jgi:hypothetical protein
MKVFIDTGAWIAYKVDKDEHSEIACLHMEELMGKKAWLYTNIFVLSETYSRLIYDVNLNSAVEFKDYILEGVGKHLKILNWRFEDQTGVWDVLQKYSDHKLSFTDATIVANVKTYRLNEVFTFDDHFRDIGLATNEF